MVNNRVGYTISQDNIYILKFKVILSVPSVPQADAGVHMREIVVVSDNSGIFCCKAARTYPVCRVRDPIRIYSQISIYSKEVSYLQHCKIINTALTPIVQILTA